MPYSSSPQPIWHQGPVSWKKQEGVIQAHYLYCALYCYYYSIVIDSEIITQLK